MKDRATLPPSSSRASQGEAPTGTAPSPATTIGRYALRRVLYEVLPSPKAFEALVLDHFFPVYQQFASGLSREQQTNLLLERVEPNEIWAVLTQRFPAETASARAALPPPLRSREGEKRRHYLKQLRDHLKNLADSAIHRARFLDLGLRDSPAATRHPWGYRSPETQHRFPSLDSAFEAYDRRLLILGAPGAGKTTCLEDLARRLLDEAERDVSAPVPLLINLSGFRLDPPIQQQGWLFFRRPAEPAAPDLPATAEKKPEPLLERWLLRQLAYRTGLSEAEVAGWLADDRVALLLDGLDEVEDTRRAAVAAHLNQTLLADHPQLCVVICSRSYEYRLLQEGEATRLRLHGAVTLDPLTPTQIDEYLDAAQAPGLKQAVARDAALRELAQVPLTLSMMTITYGDLPPERIPTAPSPAEQRHTLMGAYVDHMLQRSERRRRGRPFDRSPEHAVPERDYQYPPERLKHYLGWLAVRMSTRMQTVCNLDQLAPFLALRDNLQDASILAFGRGVFLLLALLPGILCAVPKTTAGLLMGLVALVIVPLGTILCTHLKPRLDAKRDFDIASMAILFLPAGMIVGAAAHALSALLPWGLSPGPFLLLIPACVLALGFLGSLATNWPTDRIMKLGMLTLPIAAALLIRFCGPWLHLSAGGGLWLFAVTLFVGQLLYILLALDGDSVREKLFLLLMIVLLLVLPGGLLLHVADWTRLVLSLIAVLGIALLTELMEPAAFLSLLTLGALLLGGAAWKGPIGAPLGALCFCLGGLLWISLDLDTATAESSAVRRRWNRLSEPLTKKVERWLLGPASLVALCILRRSPLRWSRFLRYSHGALLLKNSSHEIEFTHRRLRDYFALRELLPRLQQDDPEQKLAAITALRYQGEAAIELLADYIQLGSAELQCTAIESLVHIRCPEADAELALALRHPQPKVRTAVVHSLRHLDQNKRASLLAEAAGDPDPQVQLDVLYSLRTLVRTRFPASDLDPVLRRLFPADEQRPELLRSALMMDGPEPGISIFDAWLQTESPSWIGSALGSFLTEADVVLCCRSLRLVGQKELIQHIDAVANLLQQAHSPRIRQAAAETLRAFSVKRPSDIPILAQALRDPEARVRLAAADAIGPALRFASPVPIRGEAIVQVLDTEPDPGVRAALIRALRYFLNANAWDEHAAKATLLPLQKDPSAEVRDAAAEVLARLKSA